MICEWCIEKKQPLVAQNVLNSTRFSYSTKQGQFHSEAHLLAQQCHTANLLPEKNPANLAGVGEGG